METPPTTPIKRKRGRPPLSSQNKHVPIVATPPATKTTTTTTTTADATITNLPIEEQYRSRVQEMRRKKKKEQSKIRKDLAANSVPSITIPKTWIEHIISSLTIASETKLLKYPTVVTAIKKYLEATEEEQGTAAVNDREL